MTDPSPQKEEMIEIEGAAEIIQDPPIVNNDDTNSLPLVIDGPADNGLPEVALVQNPQNVNSNETGSLPLVTEDSEDTDMPPEISITIQGLLNVNNEDNILPLVTDGAVSSSGASVTIVSHEYEAGNLNNNILPSPVDESLLLTIDPNLTNQIIVSGSENNLVSQQGESCSEYILVNENSVEPCLDNRILLVSDVPEVVASEEITSSPPFYGFNEADAEKMIQKSNLVQNVLLLSSAAPELDDSEVPEFDIVVPMELKEPCDDFASSLEFPLLS